MDVQQIKFNQDLFKNKIKLERQLEMINDEIREVQTNCNHICIVSGYKGEEYSRKNMIRECLFCRTEEFDSEKKYPTIYGYTYKRLKYGNGEDPEQRHERIKEILELWIKIKKENPEYNDERLIELIDTEISKDEQKNQTMEKTLKHPIIDRKNKKGLRI